MRTVLAALLLIAAPATWPAARADTPTETRPQLLDRLFGMLKVAPDEHSAGAVEGAIQGQWVNAATPAVKLLLLRGMRELSEDHPQDALDDLDAALDLQPDLVEGWRGRALARARLGDTAGAEHDIAETIKREPREFEALQDLSHIAEQAGDWKGAYAAWSQVMDIDPMTPGGADRLKDLKRRAFGDET
jgi:tetratricopeptide (TPR) repeat protein